MRGEMLVRAKDPAPFGFLQLSDRSRPISLLLLFLAVVELAVFLLPYHFPVPPSISLSYQVGYSNKAALGIFILGSLAFAVYARGGLGHISSRDSRLSPRLLGATLLLVLGMCLVRSYMLAGGEARYMWHRQELVLAGQHLYSQTDFFYGPLLVMPGVWFARYLHLSGHIAYCLSWTLQWLAGTCLVYLAVQAIPVSFRYRAPMFWALMIEAVGAMEGQGTNYSPLRRYAAAALVIVVFRISQRFGAWPAVFAGIAAVLLGLVVSPEQGIGVAGGVLCWLILQLWITPSRTTALRAGVFALGAACSFASLIPTDYFAEFHGAASGGHAFPLLATPYNAALLFLYASAICIAFDCVRRSARSSLTDASSLTCLYVFTGVALLPAAFGRCDGGHFRLAFPALLIAAAALLAMPRVRPWLAIPGLFLSLHVCAITAASLQDVPNKIHSAKLKRANGLYLSGPAGDAAVLAPPSAADLPCDRHYYTPTVILALGPPYRLQCVDVGFKESIGDIYSVEQLNRKLDEMRAHANDPVLLYNKPLDEEFKTPETSILELPAAEGGPTAYLPRMRNPAVSLDPLIAYMQAHYRPGATVLHGQIRIWEPIH